MLFAQAGGPFGGGRPNQIFPPEFLAAIVIVMVIAIAIGLIIQIFYLLTLSRCFSRIAPRNRRMEPGLVWLNLIPCFQLIWIFFTTTRLADSLATSSTTVGCAGTGTSVGPWGSPTRS
jgi:hypothetical protein